MLHVTSLSHMISIALLLFPAAESQLESILLFCVKKIKTFKLIKLKGWMSKAAQFETACLNRFKRRFNWLSEFKVQALELSCH